MALPEEPMAAGQLAWRCRRGMRELDELLSGWLRERYNQADAAEQADFRALLALPDPEIAAYLLGRSQPAVPRLQVLVNLIRAYRTPGS